MGAACPPNTYLFFSLLQFPIYFAPLVVGPLARLILRRAGGGGGLTRVGRLLATYRASGPSWPRQDCSRSTSRHGSSTRNVGYFGRNRPLKALQHSKSSEKTSQTTGLDKLASFGADGQDMPVKGAKSANSAAQDMSALPPASAGRRRGHDGKHAEGPGTGRLAPVPEAGHGWRRQHQQGRTHRRAEQARRIGQEGRRAVSRQSSPTPWLARR